MVTTSSSQQFPSSMYRNIKISLHLSAGMDNDEGNLFHVELRYFSPKMSICPGFIVGWFLAKAQCFDIKHVPWSTSGLHPHCYFSVTLNPINLSLKPIFLFLNLPDRYPVSSPLSDGCISASLGCPGTSASSTIITISLPPKTKPFWVLSQGFQGCTSLGSIRR